MTTIPEKTTENSLDLIIKQIDFDAILNGTKDKEYREISPSTFAQYIENEIVGSKRKFYYSPELISEEKLQQYGVDLMYYNDGVFPYLPKDIKYLDFSVNQNDRETMTVEVTNISFEPEKDKDGNTVRISFDDQKRSAKDENGDFTLWNIVFHLGKVVEKDLKGER